MILSDTDILKELCHAWNDGPGVLMVEPREDNSIQPAGIDLRIAPEELGAYEIRTGQHTIGFLHGESYLVSTMETIRLPNYLVGLIHIRSTWARQGLLIPPTIVDPGFEGTLTLEVFNGGPIMSIPYRQRFVTLTLVKLSSCVEIPYSGKYQHQKGITKAR